MRQPPASPVGRPVGRASGRAGPARTPPPPAARGSRPTPRAPAPRRGRPARPGRTPRRARPARRPPGTGGMRGRRGGSREAGSRSTPSRRPASSTSAAPSTRTWRSSGCQGNSSAQRGSVVSSSPLRERRLVKNTNPSSEKPLSRTIRDDGWPSGDTVETTIAFGSYSPASRASSNHRPNIVTGSAARSPSARPRSAYSRRSAAMSSGPGIRPTLRVTSLVRGRASPLRRTSPGFETARRFSHLDALCSRRGRPHGLAPTNWRVRCGPGTGARAPSPGNPGAR